MYYNPKRIINFTSDLKSRFKSHNNGEVSSTKDRRPFSLIYYEACLNKSDAIHREKYLKTHYGKMFLKNRLKSYLTGQVEVDKKNKRLILKDWEK